MNTHSLLLTLCLVPCLASATTSDQLVPASKAPSSTKEEESLRTSPLQKQVSVDVTITTPTPVSTDLKEGAKIAAKYAGIYAGVGALIGTTVGTGLGLLTCAQLAKQSRTAASTISGSDVFIVTAGAGVAGSIAGAVSYGFGYLPYGILVALVSRVEEKNKFTAKDIARPIAIGLTASVFSRVLTGGERLPFSVSAWTTIGYIAYQRMQKPKNSIEEQKLALEKALAVLKAQETAALAQQNK